MGGIKISRIYIGYEIQRKEVLVYVIGVIRELREFRSLEFIFGF